MRSTFLLALLAGLALVSNDSRAENWAQWRGPSFNGSTTETNLPTTWSTNENLAWTAPLPGVSGGTPAIWGDHIFVTAPDAAKNLVLVCIDRKTGNQLWQRTVSEGDRQVGRNNMASPSPVTDGKTVIALFGTGDLAAYDYSGNEVWHRNLGRDYGHFAYMWLYGSSPLLIGDKLYVQVLERTPVPPDYPQATHDNLERESYLLCLDAKTGTNIWRHIRPTDAVGEAQEAYSTPIPVTTANGHTELIVLGGNYTTAHDAGTGEELWRCGGLNQTDRKDFRTVASPVYADGMVISCAPKRAPVMGIRDGGSGTVTQTNVAWTFTEFPSDCGTPLYYGKKLFVLDGDKQMLTCLDPKTGEKKWQGSLGLREIFRSSPTGADGKIYCISEKGTVVVMSAGDGFKVLSTISMGGDRVHSSIAVSNGQLFIRAGKKLYCVGKQQMNAD